MSDIELIKVESPIVTYENSHSLIETVESNKFINSHIGSDLILVQDVSDKIIVEHIRQSTITANTVISQILINNSFSDLGIVEILVKDIIAKSPSVLSSGSSAKIENLMVYSDVEKDKYFINTTDDIEGDLITLIVNYRDESLDVIGNMNIINKRKVEFYSDVDITFMTARVTYIKK